jgi:signal transduction histidine kinase
MSDGYKPHRPTAKRLFNQVGSRYALSNRALLFFLVPAFGSGLIFEQIRINGDFSDRIFITSIGYLATVIPLLIVRTFFLPDKPRPTRPVLLMAIFLLVGLIRGATLLSLSISFEELQPGEVIFRLVGGPIFTLATLMTGAVLAGNFSRHREALNNLADERHRLQIRSASVRAKVELQREELLTKVKNLIDPAIRKIQSSLGKETSAEVISSIRSTVDDVVRPLSLEVSQEEDELEAETGSAAIREKASLPDKLILGDFLLPFWGAILTAASTMSVAFLLETPGRALLALAAIFISMIIVLGTAQYFTKSLYLPAFLTATLVPFIYALSLTPLFFVVEFLAPNISSTQVVTLLIFGLVLGASLFFAQLAQLLRKLTTERLTAVNEQLEILNAKLRQELWLNRRRTASILHGPIQSALYSSAMKLSQAQKPSAELISEVEQDIQTALEKLNNPKDLVLESVSKVLGQIADLWSDAAEIEIVIEPKLEEIVALEPLAAEATLELVREFITNSIKHGKAKKVSVRIYQLDDSRMAIEVKDNGLGIKEESKPGFGSKLLTELSLSWSRQTIGDTTISYAEIVLSRDNL